MNDSKKQPEWVRLEIKNSERAALHLLARSVLVLALTSASGFIAGFALAGLADMLGGGA